MSSMVRLPPRQPGDEWDEPDQDKILGGKPIVVAADQHELLVTVILTNGNHQDPARGEPVYKRRRHLRGRRGYDHSVVGCLLGPTLRSVTESTDNVAQAQLVEATFGFAQQPAMPFDRKDPTTEA